MWQDFSKETKGVFKEGYSWNSDSVEITYKNWNIIFDNYTLWSGKHSAVMTRIVVPITLQNHFKFEIYNESIIREIENFFGAQDITIGYTEFDNAFTIKSNDEFKAKNILRNKTTREIIASQKNINILISDKKGIWGKQLPENEFELSYYADGKILDFEILKKLLELFKLLLNDMAEMDIIS